MKGRLSLNNLLNSNRFVMVFALLIAIASWVVVTMTTGETRTDTIFNVPVNMEMPTSRLNALGYSFISDTSQIFADVEVTGPPPVIGQLSAENFMLTADVAHITQPGTYDLNVRVEWNPAGDDVTFRVTPATSTIRRVRVDEMASRFFAVEYEIAGLVSAEGYMAADTPRLVPVSNVRVSGPSIELERVYRVVVKAELEEPLDRPWTQELPLVLLDMADNVINPEIFHLSLDIERLTVQVPVLRVRTLPLVIDFQNMPPGFPQHALRSYMLPMAETITIAGPISAMAAYEEWRLGAINLRSLTETSSIFSFPITLPSDQFVNIDNLHAVTVAFNTQNWDSVTFNIPGEDIMLINRPAGYEVTLQSVALSGVTFVGGYEEIAGLTVSDIVVEVNLSDRELTPGIQPFSARISIPGQGMVWPVEENNNLTVYVNVIAIDDEYTEDIAQ